VDAATATEALYESADADLTLLHDDDESTFIAPLLESLPLPLPLLPMPVLPLLSLLPLLLPSPRGVLLLAVEAPSMAVIDRQPLLPASAGDGGSREVTPSVSEAARGGGASVSTPPPTKAVLSSKLKSYSSLKEPSSSSSSD
jgi:hypothetical protein